MEKIKLKEIAGIVGGKVLGDGEAVISSFSKIEEAGEEDLTYAQKRSFCEYLEGCEATGVLLKEEFLPSSYDFIPVCVDDPTDAWIKVIEEVKPASKPEPSISSTASIGEDVSLGKNVYIGENCSIAEDVEIGDRVIIRHNAVIDSNVVIGDEVEIGPNVVINSKSVIEDEVKINSGAVIGSDGFGYHRSDEVPQKIPQLGGVRLCRDVEIGANTTIDRANFGYTEIGAHTKIDNLVQIAHNVKIGKRCEIASQVGIAGSTELGDDIKIGGQAGIKDHLKLNDNIMVAAQAGVTKNFESGSFVSGYPARKHSEALKTDAYISRLGEIFSKLDELEQKIQRIKED